MNGTGREEEAGEGRRKGIEGAGGGWRARKNEGKEKEEERGRKEGGGRGGKGKEGRQGGKEEGCKGECMRETRGSGEPERMKGEGCGALQECGIASSVPFEHCPMLVCEVHSLQKRWQLYM